MIKIQGVWVQIPYSFEDELTDLEKRISDNAYDHLGDTLWDGLNRELFLDLDSIFLEVIDI